jgi:hypothetical protein
MKTILILLLAFNLTAQESWKFTDDKKAHLNATAMMSFLVVPAVAYDDQQNPKPLKGFLYGCAFGASVNILKETYDMTGRGTPSVQDLTYGVLGGVIGSAIGFGVIKLIQVAEKKRMKL